MKTPMQEHIEWLDIQWGNAKDCGEKTIDFEIAIAHAQSMLEKEKEVMCEFAIKYAMADRKEPCETSTQLVFDETFNTNSK